jgi:hypothetical protein
MYLVSPQGNAELVLLRDDGGFYPELPEARKAAAREAEDTSKEMFIHEVSVKARFSYHVEIAVREIGYGGSSE